jgi:hypothetical protein
MPLDQPNFDYYSYESDDGTTYNLKAEVTWAGITEHALAARANGQPRLIASGSQQPRKVTYVDLTTGRSKTGPIGTAAAYAAIDIGDTHTFAVPGSATAVSYTVARKTGEKVPGSVVQGHVADHA